MIQGAVVQMSDVAHERLVSLLWGVLSRQMVWLLCLDASSNVMKFMVLSLGILVFGSAEMLYMYVNFFYQCLLWSPFHWSIWLSLLEIRHSYLVKFMEILLPMSHGIKVRRKQIINTCICDCHMFYCCCMSHSEHFTSFITACNLWHLAGPSSREVTGSM